MEGSTIQIPSIENMIQRQEELTQLLHRSRDRSRQQQQPPLTDNQIHSPSNSIQSIRNSVSMFGPHARAIEDFTRRRREVRPPSQLRSQDRLSPEPESEPNQTERSISIYERNARLRGEYNQSLQEARRTRQSSQTSIPSQFLQFLQSTTSQTQSEEESQVRNHRSISPPIHLPPTPPTNRVNLNQRPSSSSQGLDPFNGHFQDPQNNLMSVHLNDLSRPSSISDSSDDSTNQQTTESSDLLNDSDSDQNSALFITSLLNGQQSRIRRGRDTHLIDNIDLGPDPDPLLLEAAAHHNSMTIAEALGLPTPYDNLPERQANNRSSRFSRRASHLTGFIMGSNPPIRTDRFDNRVEPPSEVGLFQSVEIPEPNPSTENQDVIPRSSIPQTTDLNSNPQSRSTGDSNEPPNQITQLSNNRRRRLRSNNETTDWRHALVEQMHNDFDAGLDRTMAVNRLRQLTMNHRPSNNNNNPNPPTSLSAEPGRRNLVGTLRNIRSQRQANNHFNRGINQGSISTSLSDPISRSSIQVYLVYCGAPQADRSIFSRPRPLPKGFQFANPTSSSSSGTHSSSLSRGTTKGCGKLITIRSINPSHAARKPIPNGMFKTPIENVLSSDSYPISHSVGIIDSESRLEFENDPSNPCDKEDESTNQQDKFVCYCTKEYIGCLSCGHIVGHWVRVHCFHCERWSSTLHRFFYYLKQITYIPRYEKGMIETSIPTNRTLSYYSQQRQQGYHNKKGPLLQAKQMVYENDLRDGYIGSEEDWKDRSQDENENGDGNEEGGSIDEIMSTSTTNTMNQRMRSSILDSSLLDDLNGLIDYPSYQPRQSSPRYLFSSRRSSNPFMSFSSIDPNEIIRNSDRSNPRLNPVIRQTLGRRWTALDAEMERNQGSRELNRTGAIRLSNYQIETNMNPEINPQLADAEEEEVEEGINSSSLNATLINSNTTRRSSRVSNSPIANPSLNPRADSLDLDGIPIRDSRPRLSRMIRSTSLEESLLRREEEIELNELVDMGEIRSQEVDERNRMVRIDNRNNSNSNGNMRRRRGGNGNGFEDDEEDDEEREDQERFRSRSRRRIHSLNSNVNEDDERNDQRLNLFENLNEVCAR